MPQTPSSTQPPAPAATDSATPPDAARTPTRGWYGLAFVVMLIGVAAFVASINVAKAKRDLSLDAMQRLVAPGTAQLVFEQPGDYLIYYEKIGSFNGEDFDTTRVFREAPALHIDLQNNDTGEFVPIRQAKLDASETQMFNHGRANSEFVFTLTPEHLAADATEPTSYTMTAAHENQGIDDRVLLAVGPPVVGSLMSDWRGPFGGAAVLAFAFVISATTVLVTWMLRHGKVTRRDEAAA